MAKSKNGGSRAYIRGRLGSDVYSVGKNALGQKQQVVRSLAESVSNPRTTSQMFGRMVMSTVMQAVSALKPVIDHSFDGVPSGQPSISEFIRRNYALIKEDATAHPTSGNRFGLVSFQENGAKPGVYFISDGEVVRPDTVYFDEGFLTIGLDEVGTKVSDLVTAMGVSRNGYLTYVAITSDGTPVFARLQIADNASSDTVVSADNLASILTVDANVATTLNFDSGAINLSLASGFVPQSYGAILSEKTVGSWAHSKEFMYAADSLGNAADIVLPTYPVGTEMFLNGGEL